jgi:uncharacterized protein (TIGR03435 family)
MMRLFTAGVVTVGGSVALSMMAKATVATAIAIVAGWLARRQRAAIRHLIFVAAFAVLALLPVATAVMPAVPVPVRVPSMPAALDTDHGTPLEPGLDAPMVAGARPSESRDSTRRRPELSTFTVLATVWLVGAIGCLVRVALGLWQVHHLRRTGLPWPEAQTLTTDLARDAGFERPVAVLVHEAIAGPMTCGMVRPALVFPLDARTWRDADLRRAVTHEVEHVRRRDWVTFCLARTICALYWFHPLVWFANRQLCVNAERACDDAVVRDHQAVGYADQLVTLAERSLSQRRRPLLAMANRHDLSTRVHAVLSTCQQRGPAGVWARITIAVAVVASLAALAPLRTVASTVGQTPGARPTPAGPSARPQFEIASIKPSFSDSIMNVRLLPDRLLADGTLQVLMQYAYSVQPFHIVGGPQWLTTARYDVNATAGAAAGRDQLLFMLRSLLEERFQLKTHRETRELPVYTLVSGGGGLTLPEPDESACVESAADAAVEWAGGRMAFPGELQPARGRCGSAIVALGPRGAEVRGGRITMSELARMLSMLVGRSVLDTTGFTAPFDVQLEFVPDDTTPAMPAPPPGSGISGIPIGRALQEQLGLRLQSARRPLEVIVIDQVERPSAN